ncbi:MAG TPA: ABC transporter ATP-binding protein [Dehalococcoidia bacterium]|nr:ABC transporter ATP-binding protein [Dehalococcoidia bacterium]
MSERALVVEFRGVVKTFEGGRVRALDGVDLQIAGGEWVAVIGPSGCGKSTLLHLIAALDAADAGTIIVNGEDLARERNLSRHRAREVGLVFQLDNLLPSLSAGENVQVPMFEIGLSAHQRRQRAHELLALVDLTGKEKNRPAELSGGERQRVAIARALANEPGILLMDEPTGRLDSASGRRVLDLVQEVRRQRLLTVVLVTHDAGVAARADRIIRMLDGRVVSEEAVARPAAAAAEQPAAEA